MNVEIAILFGACVYGAAQASVSQRNETLQQIHRNYSETSYLFAAATLALLLLNGFGPWSLKGALVYAAGRALYLILSVKPLRSLRKWGWAVSIAGIVGVLGELVRNIWALAQPLIG
ncbi:MAG: MAPEG family protein [Hyphomonadaceae bacterium]